MGTNAPGVPVTAGAFDDYENYGLPLDKTIFEDSSEVVDIGALNSTTTLTVNPAYRGIDTGLMVSGGDFPAGAWTETARSQLIKKSPVGTFYFPKI